MADTGAPYFIPYVEPSDLVRNYPAANEAMADAIVLALDGAGGLVAVKSALFTGTQTASVTTGANVAVTDLSIAHETADATNRLIISAFLGVAATSQGLGNVGLAIHDGTDLIAIGNASGNRTRLTAGGFVAGAALPEGLRMVVTMPSITFVHTPGAGSKTYTVRAINVSGGTQTIFINRNEENGDTADRPVGVSSLVIQEVKV